MADAVIRPASSGDVDAIRRLVRAAYGHYVARMGRPPAPMLEDYDRRVADGQAWVLEDGGALAGLLVLEDAGDDALLVDNVAVDPAAQGRGHGRALMAFAEAEARRRGRGEVRLYTNVLMTENLALYARLGFRETGRVSEKGYERVYMAKAVEAAERPVRVETGACFCGAVAAEMRGEPFWVCYDHDDDCRRAIGSPLTVWVGYRPDEVRFTRGEPRAFSRTTGVTRTFCADCGTSIGYRDEALADELYLTIGFLDHPERFAPEAHAYWRLRLPWAAFADDLPRVDAYTRRRDPALGDPADRKGPRP